jgi:hypothetical protein
MTDEKAATDEQRINIKTPNGIAVFIKQDGIWGRDWTHPDDTCTDIDALAQALIARIEMEQNLQESLAKENKRLQDQVVEQQATIKMEKVKVDLLKKLRDELTAQLQDEQKQPTARRKT